ncbi:hypothetical protein CPLU01_11634 [Colletotrichum plurivorum]|uniref:Uncharacterized protein n=1 Tax=Colletotrichum plurivorum TaxID=2175906 RepID=A0A8H6K268_9PEZI|nr:hypothetical protein CPLU01_11634 [Colletotrichum plurivorum]
MVYQLDRVFFENWYGYWHDALLYERKKNFIQDLAAHWERQIYDGGHAYPVPPKWVPFRRFIGYWDGVFLGWWIGPFFREYTTDRDYVVAKVKDSWFQHHLVEDSYGYPKSWEEQLLFDQGKPLDAEYEALTTTDLSEAENNLTNGNNVDDNGAKTNWPRHVNQKAVAK